MTCTHPLKPYMAELCHVSRFSCPGGFSEPHKTPASCFYGQRRGLPPRTTTCPARTRPSTILRHRPPVARLSALITQYSPDIHVETCVAHKARGSLVNQMQARLWVLGVASVQAAPRSGTPSNSSAFFDVLLLPPSPMPPEPSPPPPPQPQPPEPSPPPPEPSLPPGYGHNHPVQQHSFPVEMMPYQIAVEEPTLAVQVLVSMSSLTAMLFLSLVTWQVLVNRTMARRCGLVHASHTHATRTRARGRPSPALHHRRTLAPAMTGGARLPRRDRSCRPLAPSRLDGGARRRRRASRCLGPPARCRPHPTSSLTGCVSIGKTKPSRE